MKDTYSCLRNYSHFYCIYRYVAFILTIINSNIPFNQNTLQSYQHSVQSGLTMDLTSEYYNWTEFIIIIVMLCGKVDY